MACTLYGAKFYIVITSPSCWIMLSIAISSYLRAKLIRQTIDLTHCCSLIQLPLPRTPFQLYWKNFILFATLKYFNQKDFPLSLLLLGHSASLTHWEKIAVSLNLNSTSLCNLLSYSFLTFFQFSLNSWNNNGIQNWTLLCNKSQYVKNYISICWVESYSF